MQHDEVIWQVIRHNHCRICNRSSCPLANSRYATIHDRDDTINSKYMFSLSTMQMSFTWYMKSIERAQMPDKLWERVRLTRNYEKVLEIIDEHLMYWPEFLVHKTKKRLTKMTQMRIRMRKVALKTREARREEKAEKVAVLDKSVDKELLECLRKGVCDDIYNCPSKSMEKSLRLIQYVEGYIELEEELEDDIQDFYGLDMNRVRAIGDNDEDGDGEGDEDDDVEVDRKRGRKESSLALRNVEKGDAVSETHYFDWRVDHENANERQIAVH
ncbi:hypothetical protein ACJRO7_010094 [Eucalyptus globulus]|uniref:Ribosomal eL28/Mak16 domain-containing protein n=1 Tax=Eucalyptus globulus TaxID=34317 RepID=A0ABD3LBM9_EUCGL